jgi:PAS domain S-box-containing protein
MGGPKSEFRLIHRWQWRAAAVPVLVGLAFVLRQIVAHLYPGLGPFLFFYPAVLLAALLGGMWTGIAATAVSSLLADYFIFEPVGSFGISRPSDVINLAVFTAFGVCLSLIIEKHHRYREELAAAREEAAVAEERRKAEEEREKAALAQSERQRLFEILEALPAMTCLLTPDHKIVFANRTFRERFGEPEGRPCHELCFGQANPCEFCEGFEPLKTGNAHRWELKAPGDRVLDSYVMPFTDADGSRLILKVDTDITEQRQAQAELEQHRDVLEELVQQRTRELEKINAKLEADIALRKRVELALRASEDRFRIALRNAPVSVAVQDRSLNYIWAYNQKAARSGEIIGKSDAEIFAPAEVAHLTEIKNRILREGCELREQMWFERPGGRIFLDVTWSPVRDEQGEVVGVASATVDLTPAKTAEEQLKLSEEKFAKAFDISPLAVTISRLSDGVLLDANRAAEEMFGVGREVAIGQSTARFWPSPEDRAWRIKQVLEDGSCYSSEQAMLRASGEPFVASMSVTRMNVAGEELLLVTCVDITERKRAEIELHERERRLRLSTDAAQLGIFEWTVPTDTAVWENKRMYEIFGIPETTDAVNRDRFVRETLHPEDLERFQQELEDSMVSGGLFRGAYRIRRVNDGQWRWIQYFSKFELTPEGKPLRLVGVLQDISERKQAEDALRESEEGLRVLTQSLVSGVALIDARGELSIVNKAFLRMFELEEHSSILNIKSRDWSQWRVFDENGRLLDVDEHPVRKAVLTRTAVRDELVAMQAPGRTDLKWLLISAEPILDGEGNIQRVISTYYDITERKQAEEALREGERQFHELAEGIPQLAWMTNPDGWIYWYNRRWYEYTGTTPKEMEGWGWQSVHDPNELPRIVERWKAALASGEPWEDTFPLRGADGVFRPFLSRAFPLRDAEGRITHWFGTNTDVSEMKRAEEALRRHAELLQLSFDAVIVWRLDGAIESWNAGAERLYGYTEDEAVGRVTHELLGTVHPVPWPEIRAQIREGFWEGELHHRTREGREIIVSSRQQIFRDASGIERVLEINRDITERKRAEAELKKVNRVLKALSRSNQAILRATDEGKFLSEVCKIIIEDYGHRMVWIGFAEHDEKKSVRVVAHAGYEAGYLEKLRVTWGEDERGGGPTGKALRSGRPAICHDLLNDPVFVPWRGEAIKRGYASSVCIPFQTGNRKWGAITIYSQQSDAFSKAEVDLLTELAGDVEYGVQLLRLRAENDLAREELVRSREMLGLFIENAPVAMAMFDNHMRYLRTSQRWKVEYRLGDRNLTGQSHYEVFPDMPAAWKKAHRRGLAGEPSRVDEDLYTRADGSQQWIRWEVQPWYEAGGSVGGILILTEDITKRKKAEAALLESERLVFQRQQLRALTERMEKAREEERTRVARDLHDDIGQILTAIKMELAWIGKHIANKNNEASTRLTSTVKLVNEGVHSVRRICTGLRPPVLDDLGLGAAIEWQAADFTKRTGVDCRLQLPSDTLDLDSDQRTACFRIFQECLTNISRHAHARTVDVSLSPDGGDLVLVVRDDGMGFQETARTGSLGILGMRERAEVCGGELTIDSSPGTGTAVTLRIPRRRSRSAEGKDADSNRG